MTDIRLDPALADSTPAGTWRKSSYSGKEGNCVEVAVLAGAMGLRDSKAPRSGRLVCPVGSMADLLSAIRNGELGVRA